MGTEYWTGFYQGAVFSFVVVVSLSVWWFAFSERSRAKAQQAKAYTRAEADRIPLALRALERGIGLAERA